MRSKGRVRGKDRLACDSQSRFHHLGYEFPHGQIVGGFKRQVADVHVDPLFQCVGPRSDCRWSQRLAVAVAHFFEPSVGRLVQPAKYERQKGTRFCAWRRGIPRRFLSASGLRRGKPERQLYPSQDFSERCERDVFSPNSYRKQERKVLATGPE